MQLINIKYLGSTVMECAVGLRAWLVLLFCIIHVKNIVEAITAKKEVVVLTSVCGYLSYTITCLGIQYYLISYMSTSYTSIIFLCKSGRLWLPMLQLR